MNRTENMALVVVACILVIILGAAGVVLRFQEAQANAREGAAVFDGIEPSGNGAAVIVKEGTLWLGYPAFFSEPFETVVFVFRDGRWVSFTTQHDVIIDCPVSLMVEAIVKHGRLISDALFCVHNHFTPIGFTSGDRDARRYLVRKGFAGVFGIYHTASGRFREWEE